VTLAEELATRSVEGYPCSWVDMRDDSTSRGPAAAHNSERRFPGRACGRCERVS